MTSPAKILLISPFYFPESISSGRYNSFLAKALKDNGHEVAVICSEPFYPEWVVRHATSGGSGPVRVIRSSPWIRYPKNQILRRLVLELWFAVHVSVSLRKVRTTNFDYSVSIFPPNLYSFLTRSKRRRLGRKVAIVHDLQGVMFAARSSIARKLTARLIKWLERRALLQADKVIFLSRAMQQFAVKCYGLDAARSVVAYPFPTISLLDSFDQNSIDVINSEKPCLVYSGALSEKQAPRKVLELMNSFIESNADVDAHIFSSGPAFEKLREVAINGDYRVSFHPLVPDDQLPALLQASTVQIIPQELGLSAGAFPSKLPNLIKANVGVLGITDKGSELDQLLSEYQKGASVNTWDIKEGVASIHQLFEDCRARDAKTSRVDEEILSRFSIDEICTEILG